MATKIINGKEVAFHLREELKRKVVELKAKRGITPGLVAILVGDDPASQIYVKNKKKACEKVGIYSEICQLDAGTVEGELVERIRRFNNNTQIHGILVQLPLPKHINEEKIIEAISPRKDVDGFHPLNIGKLLAKKTMAEILKSEIFIPCTPYGIIELLNFSGIQMKGAEVVIVGRSNIVGKPLAYLLLAENATVTICHSQTKNLAEITKRADILVAALGKPEAITGKMVKEGAVVIDVGINRLAVGLVGDVNFNSVIEKVSAITPVPGGVGPMTITMLLLNTVKAAKWLAEL